VNGDRWRLVSALFAEALEREPRERTALLAAAEPELRREVESLLAAEGVTGPIDRLGTRVDELRRALVAAGADAGTTGSGDRSESPPLLEVGRRLGRHVIRARLGAGGMGEVYRAFDTRLQREVAIKILRQRPQGRPGALRRLEQEARAASALNHPNIVTVHDLGEEASFPYIVMELIDGESLRRKLEGPLPIEQLLAWGVQIVEGLVAAHERQMVHGDIKPENILVNDRGVAKIVDFGLAQFWRADEAADERSDGPRGRRSTVRGTPGYLAPEVAAGAALDQRSDQFSLGVLLHELATGVRPFAGATLRETVSAIFFDARRSLAEARPDLPARVVQVIERCLRHERTERYASTRELLEELRAAPRHQVLAAAAQARPGPSALPAQRTRLIGRQRELEDIERLVRERQVRLLTLTGPGGTGKTRLALRAAELLGPHFPGGIHFVPLAALTDAALVPSVIAQAIGATVTAAQPCLAAIIHELRAAGGRGLLLLDNFEQVIEAGAALGELLAGCPDLTIIVTSREVLRLYGEQVFPVVALALPDPARLPPPPRLTDYPAIALFVERAQAVHPTFAVTADNAAAVAAVCAGLDGLPLALELAAAQSRTHSPEAMLARLPNRLGLLTGGARDLPGRQQTLRRTLDWSHQLLAPPEHAIFRRLAVFAGGFTGEAAQAVVDPYGKLELAVGDGIAALVDKSLLQAREPAADGEPRFTMLETVRAYAQEKLAASGEAERTGEAHAAYFLVLGEEGSTALIAARERRWMQRFETEYDNFRAALEWLTRVGRSEWGVRLALALFPFWHRGEHLAEGRRRLRDLIALEGTRGSPAQHARALFAAGVLASHQGDAEVGIDCHTRCVRIYRALDDRWGIAVALVALGNQFIGRGDHEEARRLLEESLQLWRELGDEGAFARSLSNLATVARAQARLGEARQLYQRAATIFERTGDRLSHAWTINHEGDVAREQGDLDVAASFYEGALSAFRSLDHPWGIGSSLTDLGSLARERRDPETARRRYREALTGFVALEHRRGIARVVECLALLAADEGQAERGLELAGAAASLRERVGAGIATDARAELERSLAAMQRTLPVETARGAWQQGAEMSLAEALQLALAG
jgi:predicted ATPase